MDLENISKLTDNQLVELYRNPRTAKEIKDVLLKEITSRELKELESENSKKDIEFTQNQKLNLLFLPFLHRYHRKTMMKNSWTPKRDKEFWSYISYGVILYTIFLFIALFFRKS